MNNIENSSFKRLLGVWKTTGTIISGEDTKDLIGQDTYELILNGNCILHRADVTMGLERSETFEIIKLDDSKGSAINRYFNSRGEDGEMRSFITNNDFRIEGNGLKFTGSINEENTKMNGKWFIKSDKQGWIEFMDINLDKQEG